MATHIEDIPKPFYAYIENSFLYNQKEGHNEFTECLVFGLSSLPSRAWGLSVLLKTGALIQHVPVHAISFTDRPKHTHPLDHLQVWNCYGWEFSTHEYKALSELPVKAYLKGEWETGRYLFTAAPYGDHFSMTPDQHKHFNFIQLDCGRLAALPGNRMMVFESSFVSLPTERPKYVTNTHTWRVENLSDATPFDSVIDPATSL